ncbi:MAG: TRAP transporter fused permease subunit [Lawsonibacter sp.]|nr:TRAP transporter fused permease subunit [Lawsonibacter sp.]
MIETKKHLDHLFNILELVTCIAFVCFHLYTAAFGMFKATAQKSVHLGLILIIVYITLFRKDSEHKVLQVADIIAMLLGIGGCGWLLYIYQIYELRNGITTTIDVVFGVFLIVSLIYATWRRISKILSMVVLSFIAYAFLGKFMPSILAHSGFRFARWIHIIVYTSEGIQGTPLESSATFICLFIILGTLFTVTGIGDYFTKLATSMVGNYRGGPAKVAIVASALFGTISGTPSANVIGTGTFSIPMMKKLGYEPEFAGAVEAVASTGGSIMPPVMATAAFLIAEILGITYWDVVKAAFIPAVLYYFALYFMVDLYSLRHGLNGLKRSEMPNFLSSVRKIYLLFPMVLLILLISVYRVTITRAGIITIVFTIVLSLCFKETRLNKAKLKEFFLSAGRSSCGVAVACAVVGIIVGTVTGSGLSFRLSAVLVQIADGRLWLLLLITALTSLILGMGMPATACYLVLATLVAPAIIAMDISPIAAHLFVFYFGIISNVTPPVALAAYTASGIAQCNPSKCGYTAFKLALNGFILPFVFVYNNVLLNQGSILNILWAFATACIGTYCLACSIQGYTFAGKPSLFFRILAGVGALLCIWPGLITDGVGIATCVAVHLASRKMPTAKPTLTPGVQ